MSTPEKGNFGELLAKVILPKVQLIALLVSAIGLVFHYLNLNGSSNMLMMGFTTLAATFFLSAFAVVSISATSKHNPSALILYKVLYLAAPVILIGSLFYILHFEGFKEMLLVGCVGLGGAILISATLVSNQANMAILKRPLLLTLPAFLLGIYFLYKISIL